MGRLHTRLIGLASTLLFASYINAQNLSTQSHNLEYKNYISNTDFFLPWITELRAHDIPHERIKQINKYDLEDIVKGINNYRYPASLIQHKNHTGLNYISFVAGKSKDSRLSTLELQQYIKKKLDRNNHLYRADSNFSEYSDQILDVNNKIILLNLKRIVDYFEKKDNWENIRELFKFDDAIPYERGAMLTIDTNNKVKFVEIHPTEKSYYVYDTGSIRYYATRFADIHTHPMGVFPSEFSGPSGCEHVHFYTRSIINRNPIPNPEPGKAFLIQPMQSDIHALRAIQSRQPYLIKLVASKINDSMINLDSYFIVHKKIPNKKGTKSVVKVIDIELHRFTD